MTFNGPQVWAYCSKRCELGRSGHRFDVPAQVITEMSRLFRAKEMAPEMDKHIYQEQLDMIDQSSARVILRPEKAIDRDSPAFWEFIMTNQEDKYDRARIRLNQELLRTLRRLVEAEEKSGVDMRDLSPVTLEVLGLSRSEVRTIASSGAIEKYLNKLPASPEFWASLSDHSDDEIEELISTGAITPATRMGDF